MGIPTVTSLTAQCALFFNPIVSAWHVKFEPVSAGLLLEPDRHTTGIIENSIEADILLGPPVAG